MGRPKQPAPPKQLPKTGTQLAFRIDDDLLALLDKEADRMRAERPGVSVTRSEVARDLLYRALRTGKRGAAT